MFDVNTTLAQYQETLLEIKQILVSPGSPPTTEELQSMIAFRQTVDSMTDQVSAAYARSGNWANEGFLTAKTAIVHTTGIRPRSVNIALAHGHLLLQFPVVDEAVRTCSITNDHIACLVPLTNETYEQYFADDANMLIDVAKTVNAEQFSYVVRHWKNMIDAVIDEPADEYLAFQERKIFLSELPNGNWFINGELDAVTGKIVDKALKSGSEKLWNMSSPESKYDYTPAQQRVDVLGHIANGYLSSNFAAISPMSDENPATEFSFTANPSTSVDIVVDINDVNSQTKTREFLTKCLTSPSPLINTHSRALTKQILCDTYVQLPIKNTDGTYELGRTVRTAPLKMKKQLMLSQPTCSIPGCITPSGWCDAHHIEHWVDGGVTSIENLALLCRRHHTMLHNDKTFEEKHSSTLKRKPPPLKAG